MLVARGITREFRNRRGARIVAVAPTDLEVRDGEYVAIVGASGSGKTTLQLMLGAMLTPSSGEVVLGGQDVYAMSDAERAALRREQIGFVFQSFHLVPYLSARENVQVPLWLAGVAPGEQVARADTLLSQLGLGERADHRPGELSAGQRQRVALARTLANEPALVLADEPTGNLDPESALVVADFLYERSRAGAAVVVVTHDLLLAERADRTLRMTDGVLAEAALRA